MSTITIDTQTNNQLSDEKHTAENAAGFQLLSALNLLFWRYTEETSDQKTKSFEGIL